MKERILYLDIIRIMACVMIIAMHAPIPETGLDSYVLSTDSLMTAPGIGLFIMVSGALLLPVKMPTKDFLCRRLGKIVGPTLLWSLFYMIVWLLKNNNNLSNLFRSILSLPFCHQYNGVLWFMYMLAGLYLLAPVLSAWLGQATQREVLFYLCLWGITLSYPLIRSYIGVNESHTGILYYFGGYVGYFLLGYYLNNYVERLSLWKCILLIVFPLSIAATLKLSHVSIVFYDLFWYLSIFIVMMAVAWFMLVKKLDQRYNKESIFHRCIVLISNCCFGIYLLHIFVMRSIMWKWTFIRNIEDGIQIVFVTIFTFVGSFLIIWLISYLPFAEYIIGFKQKR